MRGARFFNNHLAGQSMQHGLPVFGALLRPILMFDQSLKCEPPTSYSKQRSSWQFSARFVYLICCWWVQWLTCHGDPACLDGYNIVACQGSGVSSKPTILRMDKTTRRFSPLKRWTIPSKYRQTWLIRPHWSLGYFWVDCKQPDWPMVTVDGDLPASGHALI